MDFRISWTAWKKCWKVTTAKIAAQGAWIPTVVTNKERSFTGHARLQELLDAWFSPNRFESETFCERLGVLFIKRYVPTGGDFFIRRYGIRIAHIRGSLESLIHF